MASAERLTVEVLIGWRVRIDGLGEGIVTGIRKRRLRSTLFFVNFSISGAAVGKEESVEKGRRM